MSAIIITLFMFLAGNNLVHGQDPDPGRVLFLGNSVFYYEGGLYQSFEGFSRTDGLDFRAFSQRKSPEFTHGVDFLEYGRIPNTLPEVAGLEEIHALIRSGNFDYVILEARREGYLLPEWAEVPERSSDKRIPYEESIKALGWLHRTIVESGGQTVLYVHPGHRDHPLIKHKVFQIYNRLHEDLERMEINGHCHNVILVPASLLWLDAQLRYPPDKWYADPMHGSPLARYASACMLYTYISGRDPRQNDFRELPRDWSSPPEKEPEIADEEDAQWIKEQVWLYYSAGFR